jgi:hypothetical protein
MVKIWSFTIQAFNSTAYLNSMYKPLFATGCVLAWKFCNPGVKCSPDDGTTDNFGVLDLIPPFVMHIHSISFWLI